MSTPSDPVCPECGEPVGATSTYCMHCDSDFAGPIDASDYNEDGTNERQPGDWGYGDDPTPASDWGDSDADVTEHPSGWDDAGPGDTGHTEAPMAEGSTSTTESSSIDGSSAGRTTGDTGDTGPTSTGDAGAEPGGLGQNVLQSAARVGAVVLTVIAGIITTVALMILTVEVVDLWIPIVLVGFVGIVTAGVVVARQDTGIDALADALYITAATLVFLPLVFFLFLPTGDPIVERLIVGSVFSLFGAFVGVPLFVVGWWLQPDEEEIPFT